MTNPDVLPPFGGWLHPVPDLPAPAWAYLRVRLGPGRASQPVDLAAIAIPASRLDNHTVAALAATGVRIHTDDEYRLRHAGGMSYRDLLAQRSGQGLRLPDAVACPQTHDEVQALVHICAQRDVVVIPFGGGTSVVGGLSMAPDAGRAVVALSTGGMREVLNVDAISGVVKVQAGIRGPELEERLAAHGLTLGHFPQSWEAASVGGYAATRSSGQASTGYGRFSAMVQALRLATPVGDWQVGRPPASAAGPAMLELALGSEGTLGVITEVDLRVRHRPHTRRYEAAMAPSFAAGIAAFRTLAQAGVAATVMRLSDHQETVASLLLGSREPTSVVQRMRALTQRALLRQRGFGVGRGCGALIILGWEASSADLLRTRRRVAWGHLRAHGVRPLGTAGGRAWERGRFSGPSVRDALLNRGYLVETLESATTWAGLPDLDQAVRRAITDSLANDGLRSVVMVHLSHVYETGASLYWTVLAETPEDSCAAAAVWWRAKSAAMDAIVAQQATVTHHHAVGRDHGGWLGAELGEVGVSLLGAVHRSVDPTGIMNPGVLQPSPGSPGADLG